MTITFSQQMLHEARNYVLVYVSLIRVVKINNALYAVVLIVNFCLAKYWGVSKFQVNGPKYRKIIL